MTQNLASEIKKEIGYSTTTPPACKDCKFSKETENSHVDRMWDLNCHIAGILGSFTVQPHHFCAKFDRKERS